MQPNPILWLTLAVLVVASPGAARQAPVQPAHRLSLPSARTLANDEQYPYRSERFTRLVADSYRACGASDPASFYPWMQRAYRRSHARLPGSREPGLETALNSARTRLAGIRDPARKAASQVKLCAAMHRMVKSTIPRFSLDRGFEFFNVVRYGERQCFLQAVLIAGLLQRAGVPAGIAMVYRNIQGQETNNGHAVTLVRLADGHDLIVDASDPEPFARQQGLFLQVGDYQYADPIYKGTSDMIVAYRSVPGGGRLAPRQVRTLDLPFIRSQFAYYRGERRAGGLLARAKTRSGLAAAEKDLRTSVARCPRNPLAVYMLGRARLAQGRVADARRELQRAHDLYARFGWVPPGPRQYLAAAR